VVSLEQQIETVSLDGIEYHHGAKEVAPCGLQVVEVVPKVLHLFLRPSITLLIVWYLEERSVKEVAQDAQSALAHVDLRRDERSQPRSSRRRYSAIGGAGRCS
jgi:hypothetical protein